MALADFDRADAVASLTRSPLAHLSIVFTENEVSSASLNLSLFFICLHIVLLIFRQRNAKSYRQPSSSTAIAPVNPNATKREKPPELPDGQTFYAD